ncbi:MAG: HK97 family phage prohead protease [Planctomycetes bacterium]|nr:HK97 family phage prohead protease [Planctomycetota bacterium]
MKLTDEMILKYHIEHDEQIEKTEEIFHKTFTGKVFSNFKVADGKREFVATINTDSIDRDKEIVDPAGIKWKNFLKNPVIMLQHQNWELPIGKAIWIKRFNNDGVRGIVAKGIIADGMERADDTFKLMQQGILTTTSIGFGVLESREPSSEEIKNDPKLKGVTRIITKSELYEYSIVAIPSNVGATVHAVSKMPSWITGKEEEPVEMREIVNPPVELKEPIQLVPLVSLVEVHELDEVMTQEKLVELVEIEAKELFEVKVLGKV